MQARRQAEEGSVGTPPEKVPGRPGLKMVSFMVKYISQTRTAKAPKEEIVC